MHTFVLPRQYHPVKIHFELRVWFFHSGNCNDISQQDDLIKYAKFSWYFTIMFSQCFCSIAANPKFSTADWRQHNSEY